MNKYIFLMMMITAIASCKPGNTSQNGNSALLVSKAESDKVVSGLVAKYGEKAKFRAERGVSQVASFWTDKDGTVEDFNKFCADNFIATEGGLDTLALKISQYSEVLSGNFNKMRLDLNLTLDLNNGPITTIDNMFGSYDASAHLTEDFFENKTAFYVVLNFPAYTLKEKEEQGANWSRRQWAMARIGDMYSSRVPSQLLLKKAEVLTAAGSYISDYNILMGNLVNDKNQTFFPKDMKLISHWNLRDELKSNYVGAQGLEKQRMIYEVMKRIVTQEIPKEVINNDKVQWNPFSNKVFASGTEKTSPAEPNTRYEHLLKNFKAERDLDAYNPLYPTYIQRAFDGGMEMSQQEVEKLFTDFVSSPVVKQVAALISKRLGRPLEPFDIWYDGFKARSAISGDVLDKKVNGLYPSKDAFEAGLPKVLQTLGFTPEKSKYLCDKIRVDGARGSGHAAGAQMKGDKARLRTRIGEGGMNYKGYNIAIHEFGHNVEQTLSLYDVDDFMLNGVPNTAFTEALAFIFQKRDLEILGMKETNPDKEHLMALDNFWACYEIMGVSLVDMAVWKWMYENPQANAEDLKNQVVKISKEVWNKYYAGVLGPKDQPLLGIYSHMISYPLYLSAYPVGHLIDFQIEEKIRDKKFADEVMRMYTQGRITPKAWMKAAVGNEISINPIMEATKKALEVIK
jgi:hypothetical protein